MVLGIGRALNPAPPLFFLEKWIDAQLCEGRHVYQVGAWLLVNLSACLPSDRVLVL